jgi:hypothetical protein
MILFEGLRGAKWWAALTAASCGLLLFSNWIYLSGQQPRFLWEKGELASSPLWLAAFYFHIAGASVCLAAGFPLMFPRWTQKHPLWHRGLGYVYFTSVLWMAAPSGVALAFTAKGGPLGTLGFALGGALWWYTTWTGYRAIRRGQVAEHIRAMIRSYSLALSAPAFRLIQAGLFFAGLNDAANYIVSLWLSIVVSVVLAESCLHRSRAGAMVPRPLSPLGELS